MSDTSNTDAVEEAANMSGDVKKDKAKTVKPEVLTWLEPDKLTFEWTGGGGPIRMTIGDDRGYLRVYAAYAFPQTDREHFIQIFEGQEDGRRGERIGMLRSLTGLSAESHRAVVECLRRGCLTPQITRIVEVKDRYHLVSWSTETDRGPRVFEVVDVYKNILVRERKRVVITDVNENRYEIPDYRALDMESRAKLQQFL